MRVLRIFFCTAIKKVPLIFASFFQSTFDGNLTTPCPSDISFFISFFFAGILDCLTEVEGIERKNTLVILK